MNSKDIEIYFRVHNEIGSRIEKIVTILHTGKLNGRMKKDDYDSFEIDGGNIKATITISSNCGCCGDDYNTLTFPRAILLADDWENEALTYYNQQVEEIKRLQEEAKERYKAEEAEREAIFAKSKIAIEKRELKRLKKKYEG